eukprot:TRINITY_DN33389_c0_g1_i1.p1 TRINITY_DN33389_c0_g1~~TRINITY_DN33389_c0_g1_i1.p1  ORF type:complete len:678 (-),score=129.37 TRINITY_DN33389_c0_g1_i1:439-2472(-)
MMSPQRWAQRSLSVRSTWRASVQLRRCSGRALRAAAGEQQEQYPAAAAIVRRSDRGAGTVMNPGQASLEPVGAHGDAALQFLWEEMADVALPVAARTSLMREPVVSRAHYYADPGAIAPALLALAESDTDVQEKRKQATRLLRGCWQSACSSHRDLAADASIGILTAGSAAELRIALIHESMKLQDAELGNVDDAVKLAAQTPLPMDGLLAMRAGPTYLNLSKVKPLDVLRVPEHQPVGMPHSLHSFLRIVDNRQGPLWRGRGFMKILKEEREKFLFVAERVRAVAPEFFQQYAFQEQSENRRSKQQLWEQCDGFLVALSEKLFALMMHEQLAMLSRRQLALDTVGSTVHRHRFVRDFRWEPPPLEAVVAAFGIDARAPRQNPQDFERPLLNWQRARFWRRKRTFEVTDSLLPTLEELGEMVLTAPLKHRLFASTLADLHGYEDALLQSWYSRAAPGAPVLHVLWSIELVQALCGYLVKAMKSYEETGRVGTVLCLGSGSSRLRHYLDHILGHLLGPAATKVVAAVPAVSSSGKLSEGRWSGGEQKVASSSPIALAESELTLQECMEVYSPTVVICACMPPEVDWSRHFRRHPSVREYLLIGPKDSWRSGNTETWSLPEPFRSSKVPRLFEQDGFHREELYDLSRYCIGTEDAPGRVGANSVISFRRVPRGLGLSRL